MTLLILTCIFSYDYKQCSLCAINNITKRHKTPIIVGGSYFYLRHLLYGIETDNIPPDWHLRGELKNKTIKELQAMLKHLSLSIFNKLNQSDRNNPQRLKRKIEIFKSETDFQKKSDLQSLATRSRVTIIGLKFGNKFGLCQEVKTRLEKRLKNGAIKEVEALLEKGYSEQDPGLKTIGYRQIIQYLKGRITKQQAINQWLYKEIQYAKRQYTFMKKDKNIKWQNI